MMDGCFVRPFGPLIRDAMSVIHVMCTFLKWRDVGRRQLRRHFAPGNSEGEDQISTIVAKDGYRLSGSFHRLVRISCPLRWGRERNHRPGEVPQCRNVRFSGRKDLRIKVPEAGVGERERRARNGTCHRRESAVSNPVSRRLSRPQAVVPLSSSWELLFITAERAHLRTPWFSGSVLSLR
jgi:hypothetical protein